MDPLGFMLKQVWNGNYHNLSRKNKKKDKNSETNHTIANVMKIIYKFKWPLHQLETYIFVQILELPTAQIGARRLPRRYPQAFCDTCEEHFFLFNHRKLAELLLKNIKHVNRYQMLQSPMKSELTRIGQFNNFPILLFPYQQRNLKKT